MKSVTLPDLLTEAQIALAAQLYRAHGMDAVKLIQTQIIEPNMSAINQRLGQENDSRYIAYAVVYVLSETES